jgi:hypothetical protein
MRWSRGGAVAHSQTAHTSAPFVDSLRPLFPYLHCVRKVATIPLGVVHAPPGQPFRSHRVCGSSRQARLSRASTLGYGEARLRSRTTTEAGSTNQKDTQMRGLARGHGRDPELSSSSY